MPALRTPSKINSSRRTTILGLAAAEAEAEAEEEAEAEAAAEAEVPINGPACQVFPALLAIAGKRSIRTRR